MANSGPRIVQLGDRVEIRGSVRTARMRSVRMVTAFIVFGSSFALLLYDGGDASMVPVAVVLAYLAVVTAAILGSLLIYATQTNQRVVVSREGVDLVHRLGTHHLEWARFVPPVSERSSGRARTHTVLTYAWPGLPLPPATSLKLWFLPPLEFHPDAAAVIVGHPSFPSGARPPWWEETATPRRPPTSHSSL